MTEVSRAVVGFCLLAAAAASASGLPVAPADAGAGQCAVRGRAAVRYTNQRRPDLVRSLRLFRVAPTSDDTLPGPLAATVGDDFQTIDIPYIRQIASLGDGERVFAVPGTFGPQPPKARCLARLSRRQRSRLLARNRELTARMIWLEGFAPDGTNEEDAFTADTLSELREGSNIGGIQLAHHMLLVGFVPDGVASVSVDYECGVVFTTPVRDNVFMRSLSVRHSVGSGDPPRRDAHGAWLRTIRSTEDGTIIIDRPGHRRQVIPGD